VFIKSVGAVPVEYGIYGIATPLLFYLRISGHKENVATYVLVLTVAWMFLSFV